MTLAFLVWQGQAAPHQVLSARDRVIMDRDIQILESEEWAWRNVQCPAEAPPPDFMVPRPEDVIGDVADFEEFDFDETEGTWEATICIHRFQSMRTFVAHTISVDATVSDFLYAAKQVLEDDEDDFELYVVHPQPHADHVAAVYAAVACDYQYLVTALFDARMAAGGVYVVILPRVFGWEDVRLAIGPLYFPHLRFYHGSCDVLISHDAAIRATPGLLIRTCPAVSPFEHLPYFQDVVQTRDVWARDLSALRCQLRTMDWDSSSWLALNSGHVTRM